MLSIVYAIEYDQVIFTKGNIWEVYMASNYSSNSCKI